MSVQMGERVRMNECEGIKLLFEHTLIIYLITTSE